MSRSGQAIPTKAEVEDLFLRHHGDPKRHGWRVRYRHRAGYVSPDLWYQCVVHQLVSETTRWIDVGGGHSIFPHNATLSRVLANRCEFVLGLDPSSNIEHNPFVHARVRSTIETFEESEVFDLATLRMVAEHIEYPEKAVAALSGLVRPGGHVVVLTPYRFAPSAIAASLVPDALHHYVTALLWQTKPDDVFPTRYLMNTRDQLKRVFEQHGFVEQGFVELANCSISQRLKWLYLVELGLWRLCRRLRVPYPEKELLGIYMRS